MLCLVRPGYPTSKRKKDDASNSVTSGSSPNKKKKQLTTERREERNLREKERSLKITQQIHELRELLSSGGVIVPKASAFVVIHTLRVIAKGN